ncbi:MAG: transcription-repair coupling factor, partial [Armatimonadetes bacterium]|nr:transcription-repair coupling factor [Armatimonadota bacterium]
TQPMPAFDGNLAAATEALQGWRAEGYRLYCTTHQVGRLEQILSSHGIHDFRPMALDRMPPPGELWIVDQRLSAGFLAPDVQTAVVTDHEVFGWRRARPRRSRDVATRGSTALASLTELAPGEYVVHTYHGVGVYVGLVTREVAGVERDYLQVDYAGADKLYVPVAELDRLQRYLGPEGHEPAVNGLGDNRWRKATARARQKAQAVARDLVELYARRMAEPGHAFAADTVRQHQVEAAFIYEETPDQMEAVQAAKKDMERAQPMDRLLCGDVGFGKTEVAVRAAMKAVADRWQVAVLVPTTVLAQQHYGTFNERLEAFNVRVDVLSRFRSRREQVDILDRLRTGEIDIIIGTHRLLSEDVRFHQLGLLVIDEEQRFGVRHKERIKELRVGVDVLTMTATPLPRTLNQAMVGIRELSLLQDPPLGRLPVLTTVAERRDDVVREALLRELERDGQVYFLHNRVRSIERAANHVQRLVPTARVGVAHGQMHEDDLEEVMVEMYAGRYDVLVCTSIIENGLDIPNVNTIVVDDCDQFGLSQLYQLIGRVGRRERQAYAYLLHRPHKTLTDEAQQRIEALLELTELGAGFQIALRDLEIRGAGSLLGTQQSGFIEEVGYELYTQMVAEALRVFRGEAPADEDIPLLAEIELPVKAALPRSLVGDERQRIDLYRRLSSARNDAAVKELEQEVRDRYGRLPLQAENLFRVAHLRLAADRAGVATLKAAGRFLAADFAQQQALDGKEMRVLAKALARAALRGGTPGLKLTPEGLTADLQIPRVWDVLEAAEAMVGVLESARRDVLVAQRR